MEQPQKTTRERLEDQRWELMNNYTGNPYWDGLVRDRIAEIDRQLKQMEK